MTYWTWTRKILELPVWTRIDFIIHSEADLGLLQDLRCITKILSQSAPSWMLQ